MGGRGNAQEVFSVLDYLLKEDPWKPFFKDFKFPYRFYGPEEYEKWLLEVGLKPERIELLPKDMKLQGRDGLTGWIRTNMAALHTETPNRPQGPIRNGNSRQIP